MNRELHYQGKVSDSTASALAMSFQSLGGQQMQHLDCLTTRPFARMCSLTPARLWLAPYVEPWDGVVRAVETLNLEQASRRYKFIRSVEALPDSWVLLREWLEAGPVLVGPLDSNVIWKRLEAQYYWGSAHFVVVYGWDAEGWLHLHDPEGCPQLRLTMQHLERALVQSHWNGGFIQIPAAITFPDKLTILQRTLLAGVRMNRVAAVTPIGAFAGLLALADELEMRRIKSSEVGALHFGLSQAMLATTSIAAFFADITWLDIQPLARQLAATWRQLAHGYYETGARALERARRQDTGQLAVYLRALSNYEAQISSLFDQSTDMLLS